VPATYVLAIDQGTTGSRALLVNQAGKIRHQEYKPFTQYFPRPGWVEHDAQEILDSVMLVTRRVLRHSRISPTKVAAIGITNQRETTIIWDRKTGKPLHRAIVWQDRRTADFCDLLKKKKLAASLRKKTGLLADPYFSGTKLRWLFKNVKGLRQKAKQGRVCFGTVDSWLLWNLTGGKVHATDATNASRTLLYNIQKQAWDVSLSKLMEVPQNCLPQVFESADRFGVTVKSSALPAGIPIHAMIGDQQSALYGQGCYTSGSMKNTYGTGAFLMMNLGKKWVLPSGGLLTTIACDRLGKPTYALEGAIFIAGAVIQWIREEMRLIKDSRETEAIARKLPDTAGCYVVPAFVGLGAPHWDAHARGAILGITRGTTREHIIKAALESMAYQTVDVAQSMRQAAGLRIKELKVDGGASQNRYLMKFQADLLGVNVCKASIVESTAWGAAKLAGVACGLWSGPEAIDRLQKYETFRATMKAPKRRVLLAGWQDAVSRVLTKSCGE